MKVKAWAVVDGPVLRFDKILDVQFGPKPKCFNPTFDMRIIRVEITELKAKVKRGR